MPTRPNWRTTGNNGKKCQRKHHPINGSAVVFGMSGTFSTDIAALAFRNTVTKVIMSWAQLTSCQPQLLNWSTFAVISVALNHFNEYLTGFVSLIFKPVSVFPNRFFFFVESNKTFYLSYRLLAGSDQNRDLRYFMLEKETNKIPIRNQKETKTRNQVKRNSSINNKKVTRFYRPVFWNVNKKTTWARIRAKH